MNKPLLVRVASIPRTYKNLLNHHLRYINQDFDIIAVASSGKEMATVKEIKGVTTKTIEISRKISPFLDVLAIYRMYHFLKKKNLILFTLILLKQD